MQAIRWNNAGRLMLALCVVFGLGLSATNASAHAGHAGKKLVLLDTKLALKQMLPHGAKIVRRKEVPSEAVNAWARDTFGVRLEWEGVVSYFLAKDKATGKALGAALVYEFEYHHGDLKLAIGVDPQGRVTRAAILGVHEKYLPDVISVGRGFISKLDGASIADLDAKKKAAGEQHPGARFVYWRLRDMAATLASLIHQMPS